MSSKLTDNDSLFRISCIFILGLGLIYGLYQSIHWPLDHNAAIFYYIGQRISESAAPYRDLFDQQMPGAYLLYFIPRTFFGSNDLAFRLYDLLWTALISGSIAAILWHTSKHYALIGAMLFACYHIGNGPASMAERDFAFTGLLLFAVIALLQQLQYPNRQRHAIWFGFWLGCAFWIKPLALLFLGIYSVFLLLHTQLRWRCLFAIAFGALIPAIFVHSWLYQTGGLAAFYDMFFHFNLPIYRHMTSPSEVRVLLYGNIINFAIAATCLTAGEYFKSPARDPLHSILTLGLIYGILHFHLQAKGNWYHAYPLVAFSCIAIARVFTTLQGSAFAKHVVRVLALVGCVAVLPAFSQYKEYNPGYELFTQAYMKSVLEDVSAALATQNPKQLQEYEATHPNQSVQIFDVVNAHLINIAYRQGWVMPTRHFLPFPFYSHAFKAPYMDALAQEAADDIARIRPPVILVSFNSYPYANRYVYEVIDNMPPWKDVFTEHYMLLKSTQYYRVYARKNAP